MHFLMLSLIAVTITFANHRIARSDKTDQRKFPIGSTIYSFIADILGYKHLNTEQPLLEIHLTIAKALHCVAYVIQ